MFRKLGYLVVAFGLTLPAWAVENPGSISGYVRSASGIPQMGAVVEVLGSAVNYHQSVYRREWFLFSRRLAARNLQHQSFRTIFSADPARKRGHSAQAPALMLNLKLNTIFDAVQFAPVRTQRRRRRLEVGAALRVEPSDSADAGDDHSAQVGI